MEAIEHRVARDIFPAAEALSARFLASESVTPPASSEAKAENQKNIFEFTVTFLELLGKTASDLTDSAEQGRDDEGTIIRKEVQVMENKVINTLSTSHCR